MSEMMRCTRTCKQFYHRYTVTSFLMPRKKSDHIFCGESNETRGEETKSCTLYSIYFHERTDRGTIVFDESLVRNGRLHWVLYSRHRTRDLWDRRNCAVRNWNEKMRNYSRSVTLPISRNSDRMVVCTASVRCLLNAASSFGRIASHN